MAERQPGIDVGVSYEYRGDWGAAYAEALRDVTGASDGNEFRLGYRYEWRGGRLSLPIECRQWTRDARR